jgi:uncharacterized protein (DUF2267 family)
MRRHVPDAFDIAVQKSNVWLRDVQEAGRLKDRFEAYGALRAVLHALRDCLPAHEAVKLAAQMPMLLKGVYFDGWKMHKPLRLSEEGFHALIRRELKGQPGVDPAAALKAVLAAMEEHVSPTAVEALQLVLPRAVRCAMQNALSELLDEQETLVSSDAASER